MCSSDLDETGGHEGHQDPAGDVAALIAQIDPGRTAGTPQPGTGVRAVGCGRDEALHDCSLLSVGILGKRTKADWARQVPEGGEGASHPQPENEQSREEGEDDGDGQDEEDHGDHLGDLSSSALLHEVLARRLTHVGGLGA